jgi:hypothetical protein
VNWKESSGGSRPFHLSSFFKVSRFGDASLDHRVDDVIYVTVFPFPLLSFELFLRAQGSRSILNEKSRMMYFKLCCDTRFQRAFTACGCLLK